MKYIRGKQHLGIEYDWKKIRKAMAKLEIPADYYNPCSAPLGSAQWFVEMSERATGKTTGWLLLGMVMHEIYGTVTVYLRSTADQIAPKNMSSLFDVIIDNGYIEKITGGKYNNVQYIARKWYYCKTDDGGVVETAPTYFCRMISIDKAGDLKSSFNEVRGDLILFDEFIPINKRLQRPNEFVELVDVISTVFRLRESGIIVMLANLIDKYNQYFHDLEIFERISEMQIGDNCTHITDGGTRIYIDFIGTNSNYRHRKNKWVQLFAGFRKPELAAITGQSTWSIKNYQHIPDTDDVETVNRDLYIYHNSKYIRLDIVNNPELGRCMYIHWATRTTDRSVILTKSDINDNRFVYGLGLNTEIYNILMYFFKTGRIYFASNDVGSFFETYLINCGLTNTKFYI